MASILTVLSCIETLTVNKRVFEQLGDEAPVW